ncbi:hypothetical protein FACS1894218_5790 [Bacilli bacterium]|nr:hypothetical protein FACS1894218_5790 [Bacilli bacterium]
MQLTSQLKGKTVQVIDVQFSDPIIMHKLNNIGITKNTILQVLNYDQSNKILHLLIHGVEYVLREKDCRYINVRECQDNKQFQPN